METTRREFMQKAGTTVLAASALGTVATQLPLGAQQNPAAGTTRNNPTLVVVYLRGGADMLGVINPYGDKDYTRVHPTIAVPSSQTLQMDNMFGLNPNMKSLFNMYQKGQFAPIVCAGSPHPTRSHFDAQDFMERGAPGNKNVTTGWLNRYLRETRSANDATLRAFSLQSLLPRSLRGPYPVLARPDQRADLAMSMYNRLYSPTMTKGKKKAVEVTGDMSSGKENKQIIESLGARTIEQLTELNQILDKSPPAASTYPTSGFARQMRDIAKIIKAQRGLEVTALDIGGWDHHINEGPVGGQMGTKVADVSNTITAFYEDIGAQLGRKTVVMVMTEFGRTVRENANRGTDHGRGSFMLVVGGNVNGKKVYGRWTGLEDSKLVDRRDLPVHTDFRLVFAEVLKGTFGFDGIKAGIFPEYTAESQPLDLMKGGV